MKKNKNYVFNVSESTKKKMIEAVNVEDSQLEPHIEAAGKLLSKLILSKIIIVSLFILTLCLGYIWFSVMIINKILLTIFFVFLINQLLFLIFKFTYSAMTFKLDENEKS
jgi:fatty-acid desaturase